MPRLPTTTLNDAVTPPAPRTAAEEMNDTLAQILAHLERTNRAAGAVFAVLAAVTWLLTLR